jgi:hypothetical protein
MKRPGENNGENVAAKANQPAIGGMKENIENQPA